MRRTQVLLEFISASLVVLFLYASLSKFMDFQRFTGDMNNQPLPKSITPFLIWGIPSIEITIALTLIIERTRLAGLYASLVLMGLFTIYTSTILLHLFRYTPCSCGGVIRKLSWPQHLIFNLFFVGLSVTGIVLQRNKTISYFITKNNFV
jgi:putative oxidoreductase